MIKIELEGRYFVDIGNKCVLLLLAVVMLTFFACKTQKPDAEHGQVRTHTADAVISHIRNELPLDSRKPMSSGHQQTIYVFADDNIWHVVEPLLRASIERYFYTTENETLFTLRRADAGSMRLFNRFKNLLFISDINSSFTVSQYVNTIMNERAISNARDRKASMFVNNNLWANDQLIVFIMGDGTANIQSYISENSETYFQIFYNRLIARVTYQSQRLKGYKESFFAQMPFYIYIPENYRVFKNDIENRFICFLWRSRDSSGNNPDKYISIYWEKTDENPIDKQWLTEKRKEQAWKYHDEDEFDPNEVLSGMKQFQDRQALFISGMWQNSKHFMGGAFQSFAFYDELSKTAFMIDTIVYFPAGYKILHLLELESIAQTIVPK
jgi:hypothetical protein